VCYGNTAEVYGMSSQLQALSRPLELPPKNETSSEPVGDRGRVGVDAEIVHPEIEVANLSRRFFASAEADEISSLPPEAHLAAFFACWTRKEAFVKALGAGLSVPLDRFQVTVRVDQPSRLMSVDWDESGRWALVDVVSPVWPLHSRSRHILPSCADSSLRR